VIFVNFNSSFVSNINAVKAEVERKGLSFTLAGDWIGQVYDANGNVLGVVTFEHTGTPAQRKAKTLAVFEQIERLTGIVLVFLNFDGLCEDTYSKWGCV
jgi:hypothetical protein